MSVLSQLVRRVWSLPPITTPNVAVERDLRTPTRDGLVLLSDRYYPRGVGPVPTVLVRSCYGRRGLMGFQYGQLFAERGFQVVVQSTRGAYGSGGELDPLVHEANDGQDTIAWLRHQPWFTEPLGLLGASYLGYTQWAIGLDPPPELAAMSIQMGPRDPVRTIYPGGAFALENWLTWAEDITGRPWADTVLRASVEGALSGRKVLRRLAPAWKALPFQAGYRKALGRSAPFLEDWMAHPADGPYWQARSVAAAADQVTVPVGLLSGWYDAFLPDTLDAYQRLRARGVPTRLTIGAWPHTGLGDDWPAMFRDGYSWLSTHLQGKTSADRRDESCGGAGVRVFALGAAGGWLDLPGWPPPFRTEAMYLQPDGELRPEPPPNSDPDRFRYDPAHPTPSVGGATLAADAGATDNRSLEKRPDVLTYTSRPLTEALQLAGSVSAELHVQPDQLGADVFVRLCDVAPGGLSTNICDALLRLPLEGGAGAGEIRIVELDLGATVYQFAPGHCLRLLISGGAHPRWVRNYGTADPWPTATRLVQVQHVVHHSPEHASVVRLPVAPVLLVGQAAGG